MIEYKYTPIKQIYKSANSIIYRCVRIYDKMPVVIKKLNRTNPSPLERQIFKREYTIAKSLSMPGTIEVFTLEQSSDSLFIVMADGGDSLLEALTIGTFSCLERLSLALKIADCIAQVHDKGVIHKDINPTNIVLNRSTGVLKLIDFGISCLTYEESEDSNALEGTLPYISPEQTGRINRPVDFRSDLYSFGVTCYQIFTGSLPFPYSEKLKLIHSHIAQSPHPPNFIDKHLAKTPLSEIILTLMRKDAESRYQHARSVKHDLEFCIDVLKNSAKDKRFKMHKHGVSRKFRLPQKLYNREQQISDLIGYFKTVTNGGATVVFVKGYSGTGKTALVKEIQKYVAKEHGIYISGKFGQLESSIPYSAIIDAFKSCIRQILSLPKDQLDKWKDRVTNALGANARVLVDIFPELESLLLSDSQPVPDLAPKETEARRNLLFSKLICAIANTSHPTALFIDDLQWADGATLKLLSSLIKNKHAYLLLIGAYRSNEINEDHAVASLLKDISAHGINYHNIEVGPLTPADIGSIISDALGCNDNEAEELAHLCFKKTKGNPMFAVQLLSTLYHKGLLYFDDLNSKWGWRLDEIEGQAISDDIADMIISLMSDVGDNSKTSLSYGACIGNEFELSMLSNILNMSRTTLFNYFSAYVEKGLLIPSHSSKYFDGTEDIHISYRFSHDKIRKRIYDNIPDLKRLDFHERIGEYFLSEYGDETIYIFEIVKHLNHCVATIGENEKYQLVRLNYQAGLKAKASAAWHSAYEYFRNGISLLGDDVFRDYSLGLNLYCEAAGMASIAENYAASSECTKAVLSNAKNVIDESRAQAININNLVAQGKHVAAIHLGIECLKKLGIKVVKKPKKYNVVLDVLRTKLKLKLASMNSLSRRDPISDKKLIAATNIMMLIASSAYISGSMYFAIFLSKMVNLLIDHGYHKEAAYGCSAFAVVICGVLHDYDLGIQLVQLSEILTKHLDVGPIRPKCGYINCVAIKPYKQHYRELTRELLDCYNLAKEYGDQEYAALNINAYCYTEFAMGTNLYILDEKMAEYGKDIQNQSSVYDYFRIHHQTVKNLIDGKNPTILTGTVCNEEKMLLHFEQEDNKVGMFETYTNKLFICHICKDYKGAFSIIPYIDDLIPNILSKLNVPIAHFYMALSILAIFETIPSREKAVYLKRVKKMIKQVEKWKKHCPLIFESKLELLKAEFMRVKGLLDPTDYYRRAIKLSKKNGFLQEAAIGYELAASYYENYKEDAAVAGLNIKYAYNTYKEWGATAKCKALRKGYPELFKEQDVMRENMIKIRSDSPVVPPTITTTQQEDQRNLDFDSVMKAMQIISSSTNIDELSNKLIKVIVENAGADKGVLLFNIKGIRKIRSVYEFEAMENADESAFILPESVVNYVYNTKSHMVLSDLLNENGFSKDKYFINKQVRSVLCLPLLRKNKIAGILYLENQKASKVFTKDRIKVLSIFTTQFALTAEAAQNEITESKAKAKSTFLAHMSHEIRSPINTILGYSELLRDSGKNDDNRTDYLNIIIQSGNLLLSLINDILDFAKIESGKVRINLEPMSLFTVIDEVRQQNEHKIRKKGLDFKVRIGDDLNQNGFAIRFDALRLKQILNNLVVNAYKYTNLGYIYLSVIKNQLFGNKLDMSIVVEDSGVGISDVDKIFEEFEQIQPITGEFVGGVGLGLSIVRELVGLMNGTITVASSPNKGSKFEIRFPEVEIVEQIIGTEPKINGIKNVVFEQSRLLVADDNEKNRRLLLAYLKPYGIEIIEAVNGLEVIELAQNNSIDLILMDIKMPIMDGIAATKRIKTEEKTKHIPVVALTADVSKETRFKAIEGGCDGYLLKPVKRTTLLNELMKYIAHRPVPANIND